MKFTQHSFPGYVLGLSTAFYRLGLSTVSKLVRSFWGWCSIYLNYSISIHQIRSGLVLVFSVIYQVFWVVGSKPNRLSGQFFFLSNWRDLHFHEHFQLEISSKCDIKAENSSTLCKFHKGRSRKGLRRWDLILTIRGSPNPLPFCLLLCLKF